MGASSPSMWCVIPTNSGTWLAPNNPHATLDPRFGRRTALTLPLLPPPQKNRSLPLDSSPDTATPGGISSRSSTSPVCGSMRRRSLSSPSQVPCHSSPSTQVTPVTKRLDSMVRRIAPVSGSIWWIFRSRYCPTQSEPSAQARPEVAAAAGRRESWRARGRSSDRSSGCGSRRSGTGACRRTRCRRAPATSSERSVLPLSGSKAFSRSPDANQTCSPSKVTPLTRVDLGEGPVFADDLGFRCFHAGPS